MWSITYEWPPLRLSFFLPFFDYYDFLAAGPANSNICANNLHTMLTFCDKINAPVKPSKVEGPTTYLTFLGIQINTISMEASITSERKQSLLQDLQFLHARHKCTKCELLSLIGKLSFSCKVLPAGWIFLQRLIDLSTTAKKMHHHIRLTSIRGTTRPPMVVRFFTTVIWKKFNSQ